MERGPARLLESELEGAALGFSPEEGELLVCMPLLGWGLLSKQIVTKQRPLEVLGVPSNRAWRFIASFHLKYEKSWFCDERNSVGETLYHSWALPEMLPGLGTSGESLFPNGSWQNHGKQRR